MVWCDVKRDEKVTVFMLKTYLVTKLGLSNQAEVSVCFSLYDLRFFKVSLFCTPVSIYTIYLKKQERTHPYSRGVKQHFFIRKIILCKKVKY